MRKELFLDESDVLSAFHLSRGNICRQLLYIWNKHEILNIRGTIEFTVNF